MLPTDLDRLTPLQRLMVEQAFVLAKELEDVADSAPKGQILNRCESLLLGHGRDFLRRSLESSLQLKAEALEKKGATSEIAPMVTRDVIKVGPPRRS